MFRVSSLCIQQHKVPIAGQLKGALHVIISFFFARTDSRSCFSAREQSMARYTDRLATTGSAASGDYSCSCAQYAHSCIRRLRGIFRTAKNSTGYAHRRFGSSNCGIHSSYPTYDETCGGMAARRSHENSPFRPLVAGNNGCGSSATHHSGNSIATASSSVKPIRLSAPQASHLEDLSEGQFFEEGVAHT